MSMINAYCDDPIVIVMWGSNDSWVEPTSGSRIDFEAYVEWKTRLIRNQRGEEVVSSVMVYLPKRKLEVALGRELLHEDRIVLMDQPYERAIIDIRQPKDFSHPHYEVYLA